MLLTRIFCHFKTWSKYLECNFLCVIHGPQNCMKWMRSACRCWNLCFHTILWCFNPVDTIHLFLWEKNCPFWLWRNGLTMDSDNCFDVCLWQSLNDSLGHLLTLNGIEWRLKICFSMAKFTHCFQKTHQCQNSIVSDENACFPVYWNCLKNFCACKLNCLK